MVENFQRVHFGYDEATLDESSKAALDANAKIMLGNGSISIEVQGHADDRGTTDYNLALGQRRADAVVRYMTSKGVPASRARTVSYGEERPLSTGQTETAWAENRRAEFRITSSDSALVHGTVN